MLSKALQGAAKGVAVDSDFENVTLLLHGNGTNGAQNNTFIDGSSNAFTITRNGNTTQGTFSPYGDNWSNYFVRASSSYITFADNSAFNLSNSNFTIECFIFCTLSGSTQDIAGQADSSITTTSRSFLFQINGSGNIVAGVWSGTTGYTVTSSSTFAFNAWHHVALVRDGSTITLYVNGTSQGTSNISTASVNDSSNNLSIGRFGERNTAYYDGYVSNFRMVVGTAVYTAAFTPPTAPLTAITNTQLLTCQSNRFIDNSTNAFTITRNGDVSVQRFSPFSPTAAYASGTIGGSGYFDGTGDNLSIADDAAFEFGSGDFTIELWVSTTQTGYKTGVSKWQSGQFSWMVRTHDDGDGKWQFFYSTDGSNYTQIAGADINDGAWHHLAVSRSGSNIRLFTDGTLNATNTNNPTLYNGTAAVVVGSDQGTNNFLGYIAGLRILKGTAQYTAAFTPPTAPPTAITNTSLLLNFTNAGIIDNAMMNDLETVGNAQISTTQSKFGGGSMYFDGTGDWLTAYNGNGLFVLGTVYTVEMWFYTTTIASGSAGLINFATTSGGTAGFSLGRAAAEIVCNDGVSGGTGPSSGASTVSVNTWTHLAVVSNGTTTKLYLDGVEKGSYTGTTGSAYSMTYLTIGSFNDKTIGAFSGYIDDLRITKGVARYTANFTAPTAPFADQ